MNRDQVQRANVKRNVVRNLASSDSFSNIIGVRDFKVAVLYGKESIAGWPMKRSNDLIIFGADTWRELTGDEWNAYRLFLWQIRYMIYKKGFHWTTDDINDAVSQFIESFYDDYDDKLKVAFEIPDYHLLVDRVTS